MKLLKAGILCGVLSPVLWAASIVTGGMMRPEFSHVTQYISELGERGSPTELAMRYGGFVPTGLMYMVFAACLIVMFRESRPGMIAAALVGMNGLARIGAGVFPCDVGCGGLAVSQSQRMHSLFASIGFMAIIVAAILWSVVLRRQPRLRALAALSAGSGVLGLVFLMLMLGNAEPGTARGFFERLSSGTLSFWVFVFAVRLWRLDLPVASDHRQGATTSDQPFRVSQ